MRMRMRMMMMMRWHLPPSERRLRGRGGRAGVGLVGVTRYLDSSLAAAAHAAQTVRTIDTPPLEAL
jgi:hypothetical protein